MDFIIWLTLLMLGYVHSNLPWDSLKKVVAFWVIVEEVIAVGSVTGVVLDVAVSLLLWVLLSVEVTVVELILIVVNVADWVVWVFSVEFGCTADPVTVVLPWMGPKVLLMPVGVVWVFKLFWVVLLSLYTELLDEFEALFSVWFLVAFRGGAFDGDSLIVCALVILFTTNENNISWPHTKTRSINTPITVAIAFSLKKKHTQIISQTRWKNKCIHSHTAHDLVHCVLSVCGVDMWFPVWLTKFPFTKYIYFSISKIKSSWLPYYYYNQSIIVTFL